MAVLQSVFHFRRLRGRLLPLQRSTSLPWKIKRKRYSLLMQLQVSNIVHGVHFGSSPTLVKISNTRKELLLVENGNTVSAYCLEEPRM